MARTSLSVLMTSYNYGCFIGDALNAILTQSERPHEVIVVEDASTDNSLEIVENFARRYPVVRVLRNEGNTGSMLSIARAIANSSGEYIYSAAADDVMLPGFIERSMALLQQHAQAGLCCSVPLYFESETGRLRPYALRLSQDQRYLTGNELANALRRTGTSIYGHTAIYKLSALRGAGGFIPELHWYCDWFASLVIGFRHGTCYIPEALAAMRLHPSTYSSGASRAIDLKRQVIGTMFDLIVSPPYRDVLPLFRESSVLAALGLPMLRVLSRHPARRDLLTVRLARRVLWNFAVSRLQRPYMRLIPTAARSAYRRLRFGHYAIESAAEYPGELRDHIGNNVGGT